MKALTVIFLAGMLIFAVGCSSVGSMRDIPYTEGDSKVFNTPFDKVKEAAVQAFYELGASISEQYKADESTYVIIGTEGASAFSWGTLVRVLLEKNGESSTTVRVVTKRKLATNITAKSDYSNDIFIRIQNKLE